MSALATQLRRFFTERSGNYALVLAIICPVLLTAAGGCLDVISYEQHKSAMQGAADAAALGSVREAALKNWDEAIAKAVASRIAIANYPQLEDTRSDHAIDTVVDQNSRIVTVSLTEDHRPYFLGFAFPSPQIRVTATAQASGSTNVCVIGLDPARAATVSLHGKALMTAPDCAVYSNSGDTRGLAAVDESKLVSQLSCTAGGYQGAGSNFNKLPLTDCPAMADPLADRPAPSFGSCTASRLQIKGGATHVALSPGVYCGGLAIAANASVTLGPGVYVIKDGPLTLGSNAAMFGRGVGFYFVGSGATFSLESGSSVDLEAATSGALAGLLFYQAHGSEEGQFLLRSNTASNMLGTIYLPNGDFVIDTNSKVADQSAYTVIVARTVELLRQPDVVLNTDYNATDIPVPTGLGPTGDKPHLVR